MSKKEKISDYINETCISENFHKSQVTQTTLNLLQKHQNSTYDFQDKTFPPKKTSIVPEKPPFGYNGEWDQIYWKRVANIENDPYELFGDVDPKSICLGYLSDYYFLSTVGILALIDPENIKRLFTVKKINKHGIYGVWLCIDGVWKEVLVDHYMPAFLDEYTDEANYSFSQTFKNTIWMQLLEKAYAKVFGSYYNISGGDPFNCISTLTGAPCERIKDFSEPEEVFLKLDEYHKSHNIIICTATPNKIKTGSKPDVVVGNAYFVQDVVENSQEKYYVIRDILQLHQNEAIEEEVSGRIFNEKEIECIPYNKLHEYFDLIGVCRARKEFKHYWTVSNINQKSIFYIKIPEYAHTQLSIHQTDIRLLGAENSIEKVSYLKMRATLARITKHDLIFQGCRFLGTKEASFDKYLEEGAYLLTIENYTTKENLRTNFCVSAYSGVEGVSIQQIVDDKDNTLFQKAELEIWKNAALVESEVSSPDFEDLNGRLFVKSFKEYGVNLIALKNQTSPLQPVNLRQKLRIDEHEGCDFSMNIDSNFFKFKKNVIEEFQATLMPVPENIDAVLIKANPNLGKKCSFKYSTSNFFKSKDKNPDRKAEFLKQTSPVWNKFEKHYKNDFNSEGSCKGCNLI